MNPARILGIAMAASAALSGALVFAGWALKKAASALEKRRT